VSLEALIDYAVARHQAEIREQLRRWRISHALRLRAIIRHAREQLHDRSGH
jgi:hypothetical protein